jgi:hypothetical protein
LRVVEELGVGGAVEGEGGRGTVEKSMSFIRGRKSGLASAGWKSKFKLVSLGTQSLGRTSSGRAAGANSRMSLSRRFGHVNRPLGIERLVRDVSIVIGVRLEVVLRLENPGERGYIKVGERVTTSSLVHRHGLGDEDGHLERSVQGGRGFWWVLVNKGQHKFTCQAGFQVQARFQRVRSDP